MSKSIEFTLTVNACCRCNFCPMEKFNTAYESDVTVMTMPTFRAIIEKLPEDVVVHFSGFSECTLNPLFGDMLRAASDAGRKIHIYTTLAGFSEGQVFHLRDSHVEYIRLHAPDAKGFKFSTQTWLKKFRLFMSSGKRATVMAMTSEVDQVIIAELAHHQMKIEYPQMLSRGGNLGESRKLHGHIRCAADRWHNNIIFPSGDVVVCCQDWQLSMPLGNLLEQPYAEIEKAANIYAANTNPLDDSICRACEWAAPL